ncbi:transporter substrate-binding domain-containing protein [Burkholderia anthina]|uniref:transporter substrate-binding domain-containing protein n=1 Tax=Burkholderia anthina TaxID=179879 RepID=UPI001CF34B1F|nr:transporter substrate-binding domain-containing protein [Burkholderia anthina]MCA8093456.1 transporter substrate-binding domain-containing protein [Burkholderia anthina]
MNAALMEVGRQTFSSAGVLRAAINYGNTVLAQRAGDGALSGVSVDLASELARRLGVRLELVPFSAAGKVFDALEENAWDVAFLAIDPTRTEQIAFTGPYLLIEGAYMVRENSDLANSTSVDIPGMTIAVGAGSAYDLYLTRSLEHAQLERFATAKEAFDEFNSGKLGVAAGVRQVVNRYASMHQGLRVLPDSFMTIQQAVGVPRRIAVVSEAFSSFVEEMKASGAVAASLQTSGQTSAVVAPAWPTP